MSVLTIQSRVARGYVGNSAAVPCLLALGIEAIAVDTAYLSNHPAHGGFQGGPIPTDEIGAILEGIASYRGLSDVRAILSGFLGRPETGALVEKTVSALKANQAKVLYCLDPVMGDRERLYVDRQLIAFFRDRALPLADVALPNAFEAGVLLGSPTVTLEGAKCAIAALRARGPQRVVITGIETDSGIATVAGDPKGIWKVETPRVDAPASGAGDAFSALLLGRMLTESQTFGEAVACAASSVHDLLSVTRARSMAEIAMAEGFDYIANPASAFIAEPF